MGRTVLRYVLLSQVMYTQMGIHQMRVTDGLTMLGFLDVFKYHHRENIYGILYINKSDVVLVFRFMESIKWQEITML